jgi:hypothetical protein
MDSTLSAYPDDYEFTEAEAAAILRISPRLLADHRRDRQIGCNRYARYEIRYTAEHLREYRATKEVKALCPEDRQKKKKARASAKSATGGSKSSMTPHTGIVSGTTRKNAGRSALPPGAKIFAMLNKASLTSSPRM